MKKIIFRTKGNHKQGMGDITSSIALANEFSRKSYKIFFFIDNDKEAIKCVQEAGYNLLLKHRKSEESLWNNLGTVDISIVNQLNTGYDTIKVIRAYSKKLVTIDDTDQASRRFADLRINPLYFDKGALCDPKYVPLNRVFQKAHAKPKVIKRNVKNLLLSMGGSDTYGFTPPLLKIVSEMPDNINIRCIIGRTFRAKKELKNATLAISRKVKFLFSLSPSEMCKQMQWADAMICSGGITMFEAGCLGVPYLAILAEPFEEETAFRMQTLGTCLATSFSRSLREKIIREKIKKLLLFKTRIRLSKNGQRLINGKGASLMYELITKEELK